MTAGDEPLEVRQARDLITFTRDVIAGLGDPLGCATCHGSGWVGFTDDDAWRCRDCDGTGADLVDGQARDRAINRLIRRHRNDYRRLLDEEQKRIP